jgi:hypothetical protein
MSNQLKTINDVKHMFDINNSIFYACLYPKFDWFDKNLSIEKIIEPTKVRILKQSFFPSHIDNDDKFLLSEVGFKGVVRKYKLHLHLDNGESFISDVYENGKKEVVVVHENYVIIGQTKDIAELHFYKMVINTKSDLEFDSENINVIEDNNFDVFKDLYLLAIELYPEEIIKRYDKHNKIV